MSTTRYRCGVETNVEDKRVFAPARIIAAIHAEIVTRRHAADSGTRAVRARRHAKRDRAWVRDAARHNGNGIRLDNEREWMRSPIGGILTCTHTNTHTHTQKHTHTYHIEHWINALLSSVAHLRKITYVLNHPILPSQARCLRNTSAYAYAITIRSQSLLASC